MTTPPAPAAALAGLTSAVAILAAWAVPAAAAALGSAEAHVVFQSPTSCTVDLALAVKDAAQVEHRVDVPEGGRVELFEVGGATMVGEMRSVGRTRALVLRPDAVGYRLRYAVEQPPDRANRCPLWVPTLPAVGRHSVRIVVDLPTGATPAGTMPAFSWSGSEGVATLGHLPAFVHVPYALPGEPAPRDIARVMDAISILMLAVATAVWGLARKGR
jgi:hypothetical protein